jgi:hypothetical protein
MSATMMEAGRLDWYEMKAWKRMSERAGDFISSTPPDLPAYHAYVPVRRAVSLSEWYTLWERMHKNDMPRTEREGAQRSNIIYRTTGSILPLVEWFWKEPWHISYARHTLLYPAIMVIDHGDSVSTEVSHWIR